LSLQQSVGNLDFKRDSQIRGSCQRCLHRSRLLCGSWHLDRGVNYMIPGGAKMAGDLDAPDEAILLDRRRPGRIGHIPRACWSVGRPLWAVVQVVRGQRVETRAVTTGLTSDGKVQITKGLAEGDTVVMRAGAFLRDGDRVRPVLTDDAGAGK
jgi:hypothetical protein